MVIHLQELPPTNKIFQYKLQFELRALPKTYQLADGMLQIIVKNRVFFLGII